MADAEKTQLRLKLLENGWSPIPNRDKRTFLEGWPSIEIMPELIRQWGRARRWPATGLRIENGLAVIDIDVNDQKAFDAVWAAMAAADPDIVQCGLLRRGKGCKVALFVRVEEPFAYMHTRRWRWPGAGPDDETMAVEIFGGAAARQFGAFGPHTITEADEVLVEYRWDEGGSPAEVRLDELPVFPRRRLSKLCDTAERALEAVGFEPVPRSTFGENEPTRVYDLVEDMVFELEDGRALSLPDLRDALAAGESDLRCSASWLEGPQAKRRDRCLVSSGHGGVTIWESASGVTHAEATREPRDFEADLGHIAERLKEIGEAKRNELQPDDGAMVAAAKLLATYAFIPGLRRSVVPIHTDDINDGYSTKTFREMMLPHADHDIGPRGGRITTNPVDIWLGARNRVKVAGLRMRPDQPRPLYEEGGKLWVNTYRPPEHLATGGDARPGFEFMEHLLPDEVQRTWFLRRLAHKLRFPGIPGPATVMVARQQGTGRGTLGILIGRLFGQRYVKTVPFSIFTGRSYQAQYNDWGADALVALVNESSEIDQTGSVYKTRHNTYEHLKELVDPRPMERMFICKGSPSFHALSFCSYIIATNNPDALPIPADDRRFAVLSNGTTRDRAYWVALNAWMDQPANVAAFHHALVALDLGDFSPLAPPIVTAAKDIMVEHSRSDLDRAFDEALTMMKGEVFSIEHMLAGMREAQRIDRLDFPDRWQSQARRMIRNRCHRVGDKHSTGYYAKFKGQRYAVYTRTEEAARKWRRHAAMRDEFMKNGDPGSNVVFPAFGGFTPSSGEPEDE